MDATRITTFTLDRLQVWQRCKAIDEIDAPIPSEWAWGKRPYNRKRPAPNVSVSFLLPANFFCLLFLTPRCSLFAYFMQLFERQKAEDGPDPSSKWGPDHTEHDLEDPDNEDNVPIPLAKPGPSKLSA